MDKPKNVEDRSNNFRPSALQRCRTSYSCSRSSIYKLLIIDFHWRPGVVSVLPVIIFRVFSSKDNIFFFRLLQFFFVADY